MIVDACAETESAFALFFEHALPLEVTAARVVIGFEPGAVLRGRAPASPRLSRR